jgi:predicted ATPase
MALHTGAAISSTGDYIGLDLHRAARICSVGHGGQILVSDTVKVLIAPDPPAGASLRDLGAHRLKDLKDPEHLFQVVHPDLPADFPSLKSLDALSNNLPTQLTSFIGREREIAEVKTMLATARLVTLTGAGGSGKTRLALQLGADLLEHFSDGVWFVDLASLEDSALVSQTVASALRAPEQPGRAFTDTLTDYLRLKSLLLILDNCEHVLAACAYLTDVLLRACPNLRILATSREGMGIPGEALYPVPTLPVPDPERLPSMEDLVRYESVRLFIERATAIVPSFSVTPQSAKAIAQICHDLDGIPLGIELAAVRVKALTPHQIVMKLSDRFRLLTKGSRTAPLRHQTLQAAMEWSYDLLSEKEKAVLRRVSVFAGGWTVDAAEIICSGNGIEAAEMLDLLAQLADKSLVTVETQQDDAHYRLLETIRQYALPKLVGFGEDMEVHRRHRDWYLALVEQAEKAFLGESFPDRSQLVWLDHLEREHDNLRAALTWSVANGSVDEELRLATALGVFWDLRGHLSEGRTRLLEAIARGEKSTPPALLAEALLRAGRLAQSQADLSAARRYYEESLKIRRDLGDKEGIAWSLRRLGAMMAYERDPSARLLLEESLTIFRELGRMRGMAGALSSLGNVAVLEGDYKTAHRLSEEGVAISRKLGNTSGTAWQLRNLGRAIAGQGDCAAALRIFKESLELFRELREQLGIAWTLVSMGNSACVMGDIDAGRSHFGESLPIFEMLGDKLGMGWALSGLGDVALSQCDHARGEAFYRQGLILFNEVGFRTGILYGLTSLAEVARACQRPTRAARLMGSAGALRERMGAGAPRDTPDDASLLDDLRAGLGEDAFSAAWAEGRAMTLEQAIDYALEDTK